VARTQRASLVITEDTLTPGLRNAPEDWMDEVHLVMRYHSPRTESWARANASWQDRTGNARNGLTAQQESEPTRESIVVAHGVPYGFWLETRFEGRYAIIDKTIQVMGRELMGTLRGLFGRA
jgi:hypothetical protein